MTDTPLLRLAKLTLRLAGDVLSETEPDARNLHAELSNLVRDLEAAPASTAEERDLANWPEPPSGIVFPPATERRTITREELTEDDVEWVVNDNAELGVKIGSQFFWCYKGRSLVYGDGKHDDGTPMHWRPIGKREFGECIHPINYRDLTKNGTVSLSDSDEWQELPARLTVEDA